MQQQPMTDMAVEPRALALSATGLASPALSLPVYMVLALLVSAILILAPGHRALAQSEPEPEPGQAELPQPLEQPFTQTTIQQGADLTLFEPVTGPEQAANPDQRRDQRGNGQTGPAFTLVGTSRIGSHYTAILASRDGSITRVSAAPGRTAEIPDHVGYRLVNIGSRQVSLTTPGSDPCIEAEDRGVRCNAIGVTELSLATAAPIAAPAQAAPGDASIVGDAEVDPNAPPENPFAAAIRMAREAEASGQANALRRRAENPEAFQARRIPPEDVPPGMRVVRTPFGDRLVPAPQ